MNFKTKQEMLSHHAKELGTAKRNRVSKSNLLSLMKYHERDRRSFEWAEKMTALISAANAE
jgi:hypothetical protein